MVNLGCFAGKALCVTDRMKLTTTYGRRHLDPWHLSRHLCFFFLPLVSPKCSDLSACSGRDKTIEGKKKEKEERGEEDKSGSE